MIYRESSSFRVSVDHVLKLMKCRVGSMKAEKRRGTDVEHKKLSNQSPGRRNGENSFRVDHKNRNEFSLKKL